MKPDINVFSKQMRDRPWAVRNVNFSLVLLTLLLCGWFVDSSGVRWFVIEDLILHIFCVRASALGSLVLYVVYAALDPKLGMLTPL